MAKPTIHVIESLRGLPVFPDGESVADSPPFLRYNLVYGFNGSGKTTLARLFACLGKGKRHEEWAPDCAFVVRLSDGTKVTADSRDDVLQQRILVFNEDFVASNLRWSSGEANPIFYLGEEQRSLSEQMESEVKRLSRTSEELAAKERDLDAAKRLIAEFKRQKARLIESEAELGRRYNAVNLTSDYEAYDYSADDLRTDDSIAADRNILKMDAPLPKLYPIPEPHPTLRELIRDVRDLLPRTLGSMSVEELRQHTGMLPWIKKGVDFHDETGFGSCLFCGNPLTVERMLSLKAVIDDQYAIFSEEVVAVQRRIEALRTEIQGLEKLLPAEERVVSSHRSRYAGIASRVRSSAEAGLLYANVAMDLVTRKQRDLNHPIDSTELADLPEIERWFYKHLELLTAINEVIASHNQANEDFVALQADAARKIRNHHLAEEYQRYRKLSSDVESATTSCDTLRREQEGRAVKVEMLRQQIRRHGPAADRINKMINRYLGHSELEIIAEEAGYSICRNGKVTTAAPSEGERTAIALSYFLVLLEADGRKREESIVVMDDPVSSLDSRSLNYACGLMRSLDDVAQLVILTHNARVMNEIKKWLKGRTSRMLENKGKDPGKASASLLFIDTVQSGPLLSRRSFIVELPKYLREYESEYHYLFHMVLRFLQSRDDQADYFFMMPNVLRKTLEIFLAFRRPGSSGLTSKIQGLLREAETLDIDEARISALERLSHVESHGDNIDALVSASSITIEETQLAAEALIELIDRLDSGHCQRMKQLCRSGESGS